MKILLDTNVLIAAFIARGTCAELLEYCSASHTLVTSAFILNEFREKLRKKFHYTLNETKEAVQLLKMKMILVHVKKIIERTCRDPDDDWVLAAALKGNCDCIVTGDRDLLDLKCFNEIAIVSPSQFWHYENEQNKT